ncbi:Phage minor tail protein 2 [uncultured Mediterranean phage uvMED]|nr:Phage minor tail protein 2 [uncultured Mediterranean phage uvMED]BAR14796.1 Phage minor tail protein 2 [uncultured Mediterranean phage uvMED]
MAFVHGKSSVFKLDNASGSLTDISAFVNNVDFPETADVAETSVLGASNKTYIVGLKDATISLSGLFDATADAIFGAVVGQTATLSFEYSPEGTATGKIKYTGECILTNYAMSSPVGDVVAYSADLQVSGAVTRGTH